MARKATLYIKEYHCACCSGVATIQLSSRAWYAESTWCKCRTPSLPEGAQKTNEKRIASSTACSFTLDGKHVTRGSDRQCVHCLVDLNGNVAKQVRAAKEPR